MTESRLLPLTIVGVLAHVPLLSFVRQVMYDAMVQDEYEGPTRVSAQYAPQLALFFQLANDADLLDALSLSWEQYLKKAPSSERVSFYLIFI